MSCNKSHDEAGKFLFFKFPMCKVHSIMTREARTGTVSWVNITLMTAIMIMNDSININLHFWQALPLSLIASFFLFYHHLVLVAPNKKNCKYNHLWFWEPYKHFWYSHQENSTPRGCLVCWRNCTSDQNVSTELVFSKSFVDYAKKKLNSGLIRWK